MATATRNPAHDALKKIMETPAKPARDKREAFRKLANKRVGKCVKLLGNIKNLANKRAYEYTEDQRIKIMQALNASVKEVADSFDKAARGQFVESIQSFDVG